MRNAKAKFAGSTHVEDIVVMDAGNIKWRGMTYQIRDVSFQSPVWGTIYGALFNFKDQYEEMKEQFAKKPYNEAPKRPVLYIKPKNTITGHQSQIPVPEGEDGIQINATLGVVMGKNATRISKTEAFNYIAGYTIVNDVSIPHSSFFRPDIKNKVRDSFCPVGPWIMNEKEVSNPDDLTIHTYMNGELVHESNTRDLMKPIGELISEITEFMTLYKGDMLLVGIPHNAPVARPGDIIRIEINGLGYLENTVIKESQVIPGGGIG